MRDKDLYAQILEIGPPSSVAEVELRTQEDEVHIHLERDEHVALACPSCGQQAPRYDWRQRRWRHLDTCQFKTIVVADVPPVQCPEHGVVTVRVPWAELGSAFTALFEALSIDWLKEATTLAVSRRVRLSWNSVNAIMRRAVARGLARRTARNSGHIGVDETSFQRRHEYETVVSDQVRGDVLYIADSRKQVAVEGFYKGLKKRQIGAIRRVSMDMWHPYIEAARPHEPYADAIDQVRRAEHKLSRSSGDGRLKGTRYAWLADALGMTRALWRSVKELRESSLKTARAWAIRDVVLDLWYYRNRIWAEKAWKRALGWMARCRLKPMVKVGRTLRNHLRGNLNGIILRVNNGRAESINSRIEKVKARSHGFRNRERFRTAIYFHLGGLDLYPRALYS